MVGYSHLSFHSFAYCGIGLQFVPSAEILLNFKCSCNYCEQNEIPADFSPTEFSGSFVCTHECRTPKGLIKFNFFSQPCGTSFNLTDSLIYFFSSMNICEEGNVSFGRANSLLLLETRLMLWLYHNDPKTQRFCGRPDVEYGTALPLDLLESQSELLPIPFFFLFTLYILCERYTRILNYLYFLKWTMRKAYYSIPIHHLEML